MVAAYFCAMKLNYQELLPADFADSSRVWIYQSSRLFTIPEALQIEEMLADFVTGWKSHGDPVKGYANLFFGQFIILMADESSTTVGGCSTDGSVRFIKDIEQLFHVNMFDRLALAFIIKEKVQLVPMGQLNYALNNGFITADTPFFNNTIQTKKELLDSWIVPVGKSWLSKKIGQEIQSR